MEGGGRTSRLLLPHITVHAMQPGSVDPLPALAPPPPPALDLEPMRSNDARGTGVPARDRPSPSSAAAASSPMATRASCTAAAVGRAAGSAAQHASIKAFRAGGSESGSDRRKPSATFRAYASPARGLKVGPTTTAEVRMPAKIS
jgi:hypothetical protein